MPTPDIWHENAKKALEREQRVFWPELAEFRCPPCAVEQHWNHRAADGSCVSRDTIHDQTCECSVRELDRAVDRR